ncbi:MAG: DinB family protein, partial [candidate division Zixibacteria bacterium]|nr:DinB family protein [candidate division Zixibacteria bacterium]
MRIQLFHIPPPGRIRIIALSHTIQLEEGIMLWNDRSFEFTSPPGLFPNVVERLRGVPLRLEGKVRRLSHDTLTDRDEDTWSILENIGHLVMVEILWMARLDDFAAGKETLTAPSSLQRPVPETAYNDTAVDVLLDRFRKARGEHVARLEKLTVKDAARVALHPRLNKP